MQTREWDEAADDYATTVAWQTDHRPGWLVPIPASSVTILAALPHSQLRN